MLMRIWTIILLLEAIIQIECAPKLGPILFDPLSYETEKFQKVLNELIPIALSKMNMKIPENETTTPPSPALESRTILEEDSTMTSTTVSKTHLLTSKTDKIEKLSAILKMFENLNIDNTSKQPNLSKYLRSGDSTAPSNYVSFKEYYYDKDKCKVVNDRILCGYEKNKGELAPEIIDLFDDCRLRNYRIECGYHVPPFTNPRRPPGRDLPENNEGARVMLRASQPHHFDTTNAHTLSCSDCASNNLNEAIPSETKMNLTTTPHNNNQSKLPLKLNIPAEEITNSAKLGTPQGKPDFSEEFTKPSAKAIEYQPKFMKPKQELLKILSPIPVSEKSLPELTEIPAAIESLPKLVVPTQAITEISPESAVVTTNTSPELPVGGKVEMDSQMEWLEHNTEEIVSTPNVPVSPLMTQDQDTVPLKPARAPDGIDISDRENPRVLRSADAETPKIIETEKKVTKRRRWCVEKGDRIVCYYSRNY